MLGQVSKVTEQVGYLGREQIPCGRSVLDVAVSDDAATGVGGEAPGYRWGTWLFLEVSVCVDETEKL